MKNKNVKNNITGIIVICIIAAGFIGIFTYKKISARNDIASRIAELSPKGGPPQTIEGLKEAIRLYEIKIEQHVKDAAQTGSYWKILASRFFDRKMYGEALDALERAIYYNPADPYLHYMTGLCAANVARASHDYNFSGQDIKKQRAFRVSEEAYLEAIKLNERYTVPRYGIAILYVFELDRPDEAIPHLLRYLEIQTRDTDAMFLLARAYYMTQRFDEAIDLYDQILRLTKDPQKRREALANKSQILDF